MMGTWFPCRYLLAARECPQGMKCVSWGMRCRYPSARSLWAGIHGSGEPMDTGPALTENMKPIGGPSVNPTKRILANRMMRTNIPMIDMFNTLVVPRSFRFSHFWRTLQ